MGTFYSAAGSAQRGAGQNIYPIIAVILVVSLFIAPVMFSRKGKPGRRKGAYGRRRSDDTLFAAVNFLLFRRDAELFGSITSIGGARKREEFYLIVKSTSSYEEAEDVKQDNRSSDQYRSFICRSA